MAQSPFRRALALDSAEKGQRVNGDIDAVLDVSLAPLKVANPALVRWAWQGGVAQRSACARQRIAR